MGMADKLRQHAEQLRKRSAKKGDTSSKPGKDKGRGGDGMDEMTRKAKEAMERHRRDGRQ